MKKLILFIVLYSLQGQSQIKNKIEGIEINAHCEIEYQRNIQNQNNYGCNFMSGQTLISYSIQIANLYNDLNGLNQKNLNVYKDSYFSTVLQNAKNNNEQAKHILLENGLKAISIKSFLNYSSTKLKNTSVVFIYRNKSYIVNLISNDFNISNEKEILKRIKIGYNGG